MSGLDLAQAVSYARQFDPQFERKVRGASTASIDELSRAVGRPLPADYVRFLEIFGEGDGGLKLAFDGTTDVPDLIDFYREFVASGEVELPAGCLAVGVDAMTGEAIALNEKGAVVFIGESKVRGGYADSLSQLVFRAISLKVRTATYPHQKIFLGTSQSDLKQAVATAERLGFSRAFYSDTFVYCGERADGLVHVVQYPGQPLSLHFAGNDAAWFESLETVAREQFGVGGHAIQES